MEPTDNRVIFHADFQTPNCEDLSERLYSAEERVCEGD